MPPSPRLSARISTVRYLTLTTITSDQTNSDSTPSTLSRVTATACEPAKVSCSAYSGLVPRSPNTTPSAIRAIEPSGRAAGLCAAVAGALVIPKSRTLSFSR